MLTEKPWSLEHRRALLVGGILLAFVPILIFLYFFHQVRTAPNAPILFLVGILLCILIGSIGYRGIFLYVSGTKFVTLLNALQHEIVSAKISGSVPRVLTCKTLNHGEFSLEFYHGSHSKHYYTPPKYVLWITTNKPLPANETIFKKSGLLKKSPEVSKHFKDKLLAEKLMAIESLKCVMTESKGNRNRLGVMFEGRFPEASDIMEYLKLLREIEERLYLF